MNKAIKSKFFASLCFLICTSIFFTTTVFASSAPTNNSHSTFSGLDPDTIVCYYKGYPVRARDVDETGYFDASQIPVTRANLPDADMTISSSNHGKAIFLQSTLSATGFSQTETYFYLPNAAIADLYPYLGSTMTDAIATALLSLIPRIGATITIATTILSLVDIQRRNELKAIKDDGGDAVYLEIQSSYGTVSTVDTWDGWTIQGTSFSRTNLTYRVNELIYGVKL